MSTPDAAPVGLLSDAIAAALPGWRVLGELEPFGWAPDRHLRACLLDPRGEAVRVVLRRSSERSTYQVEMFLYQHVFPGLPVRTARLWAAFDLPDSANWMVLGDLGTEMVRAYEADDRAAFLTTLGLLHGKGVAAHLGFPADHPLPSFTAGDSVYGDWRGLLTAAPEEGLGEPAGALLDRMLTQLTRQPVTLLHGDTDFSNALLVDDGVALIDWENASLGPAPLDLGTLVGHLAGVDDLAPYRDADASGGDLSEGDLQELLDLANAHDALRWICSYLTWKQEGQDPGGEWRKTYFTPRVERVRALLERGL
jgi:hypothetical protein